MGKVKRVIAVVMGIALLIAILQGALIIVALGVIALIIIVRLCADLYWKYRESH